MKASDEQKELVKGLAALVERFTRTLNLPPGLAPRELLVTSEGIVQEAKNKSEKKAFRKLEESLKDFRTKLYNETYENPSEPNAEKRVFNDELLNPEKYKFFLIQYLHLLSTEHPALQEQAFSMRTLQEKLSGRTYDHELYTFLLTDEHAPHQLKAKHLEHVYKAMQRRHEVINDLSTKFSEYRQGLQAITRKLEENAETTRFEEVDEDAVLFFNGFLKKFSKGLGDIYREMQRHYETKYAPAIIGFVINTGQEEPARLEDLVTSWHDFEKIDEKFNQHDLLGDEFYSEDENDVVEEKFADKLSEELRNKYPDLSNKKNVQLCNLGTISYPLTVKGAGSIGALYFIYNARIDQGMRTLCDTIFADIINPLHPELELITSLAQSTRQNIRERHKRSLLENKVLTAQEYRESYKKVLKSVRAGEQRVTRFKIHYDPEEYATTPKKLLNIGYKLLQGEQSSAVNKLFFLLLAKTMQTYKKREVIFAVRGEEEAHKEFIDELAKNSRENFSEYLVNNTNKEVLRKYESESGVEKQQDLYNELAKNTEATPLAVNKMIPEFDMNLQTSKGEQQDEFSVLASTTNKAEYFILRTLMTIKEQEVDPEASWETVQERVQASMLQKNYL